VVHYDIQALADAAGVTPRTVRFYQGQGLLHPPERIGRRVRYGSEHLARLQQIAQLQDRGLRLDSIREVIDARSTGRTAAVALLGPELASEAWLADAARDLTAVELAQVLGEGHLALIADLEAAEYLRQVETPDGVRWRVADLPLLLGALSLADLGTAVSLSGRGRDLMRRRIRRMAEDLVRMWAAEQGREFTGQATAEALLPQLDRIRAVAWQSAAHIMAQEINDAVARVDELGEE
jgi:DNA-binding transcriptional MerR regulator